MKILLIGSRGQLGTDMQKVIPKEFLIPLDFPDIDITKKESVFDCLKKYAPDIVINTAAYNDVDRAESEAEKAFLLNTFGVNFLCDACLHYDAILVHFSTDYVYGADEKRHTPYTEDDIPGPVNMYGVTKLAGEKIIEYKMKNFFLIRTELLFGAAGPLDGENFVELMIRQGIESGKVRVVKDQIITPTYTLNLAENVWKLIQTKYYGLYHMASLGSCARYDFVQKIFELAGISANCIPCVFQDFQTPARRPKYSAMKNERLDKLGLNIMKPWEENLKNYLREKKYL